MKNRVTNTICFIITIMLGLGSLVTTCTPKEASDYDHVATVTYRVYYPDDPIDKTVEVDCYETGSAYVRTHGTFGDGPINQVLLKVSDKPGCKQYNLYTASIPIRILSCEVKPKNK